MMVVFILIIDFLLSAVHPIHISVSDVEFTSDKINWTVRIYKDDLLRGMYGEDIDISMLDDQNKIVDDILAYVSKNISVVAQGKAIKWKLIEIQSDPEAIWVTVSAPVTIKTLISITIQNRVLLDVYSDQKNVVNIVWSTGKKNIVFEKGADKKVISF